jgi:ROS/MUCR transcriptional regulator protein
LGVTGSARGYGGNLISDRASGARRSRGKRQPNSTESEHPRCQSGDPFTAIMLSASNAAGAARCSDGISVPAMDLTVDQYRTRWNLPREHALTAPAYSERRSGLAKQLGLGRGGRTSDADTPAPEPVVAQPTPKRRVRRGQPQ